MTTKERHPELEQSEIVDQLPIACANETAAVEFFEAQRWGDIPACAHCGSVNVYKMMDATLTKRNKRFLWRCREAECGKQYTVRVGAVYEESRIPLRHWAFAFWRAATSKKGASALEISRQCQISYKSALFLMHRIRFAMTPSQTPPKLTGTVEADETHIGGRPRVHLPMIPGVGSPNHKSVLKRHVPVFAAVQRQGEVRMRVIADVKAETLRSAIRECVDTSARLMTDELHGYNKVGEEQDGGHFKIRHKNHIYADGDITTNSAESVFALLKRGLHGIYHNVSRKHLHRYLNETQFRYNARKIHDGARTVLAIKGAEGKRLTYKNQIA